MGGWIMSSDGGQGGIPGQVTGGEGGEEGLAKMP